MAENALDAEQQAGEEVPGTLEAASAIGHLHSSDDDQ